MTVHRAIPRVYLAGRMTGLTTRGAEWRDEATASLSPLVAENPLLLELECREPQHIVSVDVQAIARSRAVLACVALPSWGTAMELWMAKQLNVPVISWVGPDFNERLSPWLQYVTTEMHVTLAEAVNSIRERFIDYVR